MLGRLLVALAAAVAADDCQAEISYGRLCGLCGVSCMERYVGSRKLSVTYGGFVLACSVLQTSDVGSSLPPPPRFG